jgi:hypothetical protein
MLTDRFSESVFLSQRRSRNRDPPCRSKVGVVLDRRSGFQCRRCRKQGVAVHTDVVGAMV